MASSWHDDGVRSPIPDYLLEVLEACGSDGGAVADYIPELAAADPDRFGICLATVDGTVYSAGNAETPFTIQSMSKPFAYAVALSDHGHDAMAEKIDVEPTGEAFNEISLEAGTGRPKNAMINAGAILTHSLVAGDDGNQRAERLRDVFSRAAGRELAINESAFESEFATAHRNLGMAHMMKAVGILDCDPVEAVRGYSRQCSIEVTCCDLALMAATLANAGAQPSTGEQILDRQEVRQVLSVMMTCGMYDAAGDWMTDIGIPAKSGVSGGVIGSLPGQVGIAVFSPRLDSHGSSVRGVRAFERMSGDMGMHLMEVAHEGRSALRDTFRTDGPDPATVYQVQGDLRFTGAESVVRAVSAADHTTGRVVLDLTRAYRLNDVGQRMLLEVARRLELDGVHVSMVDPDHALHGPDVTDAGVEVFDHLDEATAGRVSR